MELLARETLAKSSVDIISKIYDQNLEFVSLENRLFSLDRPGSYVKYNDPTCPDAQVTALFRTDECRRILEGLHIFGCRQEFMVCLTFALEN